MGRKTRTVEILWEAFFPANEHGNRTWVTRSAKRLTIYSVLSDGTINGRHTYARASDYHSVYIDGMAWCRKFCERELEDRAWWKRLQELRARQRGENIIQVDFNQLEFDWSAA